VLPAAPLPFFPSGRRRRCCMLVEREREKEREKERERERKRKREEEDE
jgi:hypothetical protein